MKIANPTMSTHTEDIEEITVESIVNDFPYHRKEIMPSGAEWILIDKEVLRTTLTTYASRVREEAYAKGKEAAYFEATRILLDGMKITPKI